MTLYVKHVKAYLRQLPTPEVLRLVVDEGFEPPAFNPSWPACGTHGLVYSQHLHSEAGGDRY